MTLPVGGGEKHPEKAMVITVRTWYSYLVLVTEFQKIPSYTHQFYVSDEWDEWVMNWMKSLQFAGKYTPEN